MADAVRCGQMAIDCNVEMVVWKPARWRCGCSVHMTKLACWCKSSMVVKCFLSRDGACCHKENTMLDCRHQRLTSVSWPTTPLRHFNINFHDFFDVPSWWFSNQVTRYSFGEGTESFALRWGEDGVLVYNPWTSLSEKPVLGEDGGNRRRYHNEDFFDDIFRGDNSVFEKIWIQWRKETLSHTHFDTIKLSKIQNKNKKKKNTRKAQTSSWNFVQRLYFLPPLEIFLGTKRK